MNTKRQGTRNQPRSERFVSYRNSAAWRWVSPRRRLASGMSEIPCRSAYDTSFPMTDAAGPAALSSNATGGRCARCGRDYATDRGRPMTMSRWRREATPASSIFGRSVPVPATSS